MPDLMEAQSRHRGCAQKTQTNGSLDSRAPKCAIQQAMQQSPAHVLRKYLAVLEGSPMNVEAFGGAVALTRSVRKGAVYDSEWRGVCARPA